MQKWIFLILFISASVLGIGVLFDNVATEQAAREAENAPGSKLNIEAMNWKFDQTQYSVKSGEETKISFINKEGIHAIHITGDGVDIKLDRNTPSEKVTFVKPGTYTIQCVLPCGEGHAEMIATLTVT